MVSETRRHTFRDRLQAEKVTQSCDTDPQCFLVVTQALQATLFYHAKVTDLGEAMAKTLGMSEKGALTQSTIFGENRMIIEKRDKEIWL